FFLLFLFSFSHLPFLPNRAAKVANFLASARNILKYFLPAFPLLPLTSAAAFQYLQISQKLRFRCICPLFGVPLPSEAECKSRNISPSMQHLPP
ncbi:hypothetical protein, partial [Pedobacter yulinensis]|uniref:hypothetical protein n=1 Tax=Pedobacter yulinensis TaxID=2126353 RepID=UPI0019551806